MMYPPTREGSVYQTALRRSIYLRRAVIPAIEKGCRGRYTRPAVRVPGGAAPRRRNIGRGPRFRMPPAPGSAGEADMIDYRTVRHNMVESQVRTNDVTDRRITGAMETLPRERFVPKSVRPLAYMGAPLEIADGRYLLDPRTLSKLIQAAEIEAGDLVLDVGCGTGYSTAVLAHLAETAVGLECDPELAEDATRLLTDLGIDNTAVITGDLAEGAPSQGPFDVIFINGGVEEVPETLTAQLKEGGRLAAVVLGRRLGKAQIFVRAGGVISSRIEFDATPPLLPGFERKAAFTF